MWWQVVTLRLKLSLQVNQFTVNLTSLHINWCPSYKYIANLCSCSSMYIIMRLEQMFPLTRTYGDKRSHLAWRSLWPQTHAY